MTDGETPPLEPFQCSHCDKLGEITFSSYERQHQHTNVKVLIKNLPAGISESGLKNLFLAIGKPLCISFHPKNSSAIVEFHLLNEAELAVRDLHCKPPYNLKVILLTHKYQKEDNKKDDGSKENEKWDFSKKTSETLIESKTESSSQKANEVVNCIKNTLAELQYDPSVRMRQRLLDFKTDVECVSLGRGYLYRGKTDCYVGGLQKFEVTTENSKAKNEMTYYCENCNALTTKMCGRCSVSFCSKACLINSNIDHHNCTDVNSSTVKHSKPTDLWSADNFPSQIPLKSGSVVVMSAYFTMQTVAIRLADKSWEEKFTRLLNDVAAEAFKGNKLQDVPEVGDLVLARYNEDLCFYRAQVISKCENKLSLVFIDFGNIQDTDLEDLRVLPDHLKSVPGFAVKVHLKGVQNDSSLDSVNYYNKLTGERIPLVLDLDKTTDEVVLTEKDTNVVVNKNVTTLAMPSWKKDESVLSKSGEVFYLNAMKREKLEIGSTCNLVVSHFDEKEFLESEVFWVTNPETDNFFHVNSQMYLNVKEYCEFLKDDFYLPRVNELCLAKEEGEWHRCVNLKSHKTTCCLFFVDDGHSSLINTDCIRKMIVDFIEAPSQAICCTLPDDPKLKTNKELQSKAVKYLKESTGQTIQSISVLKLMGDAYCLSLPEINKILT